MKLGYLAAAAAASFVTASASAQTAITTLDGSQGVFAQSDPGASATITSDTSLSSNGSLQLTGNRNRVLNGNNFVPNRNYGAASSLVSLTGTYLVRDGGGNQAGAAGIQSPAFRVYIQDGTQRSELIWEAAYNGGFTIGTAGTVGANDLFWQFVGGVGATPGSTFGYTMYTLAQWGDLYSRGASISAFGVGNGGPAGADFNALADNVTLTTDTGVIAYDFQATAAVPEPATWAMMITGFGLVGARMRRRKIVIRYA